MQVYCQIVQGDKTPSGLGYRYAPAAHFVAEFDPVETAIGDLGGDMAKDDHRTTLGIIL